MINQLYYTSPLHSSIIDFKTNAIIGGGYELKVDENATAVDKVEVYSIERRLNLKKSLHTITKDVLLHNRKYFILRFNSLGDLVGVKSIGSEKVRRDKDGENYFICDDWWSQIEIRPIKRYSKHCKDTEQLYVYENHQVGQDIYPLPSYTSAFNWAFLDGEMSYLQKSNILNSIFPSFAMMFPKKPQGEEEKKAIKDTIERAKGAQNAGKAVAFFANNKEQLPTIESIPTNNLDNVFQVTTESIDSKICQAHTIDPILMGIRVSGKLGSGSDIKQAYVIFEKNTIIPMRQVVEDIVNEILAIAKVKAELVINNYQIVNEAIVEIDEKISNISNIINSVNPALATKIIEAMTTDELRDLIGLKPSTDTTTEL
jgi:capsid portal protein